MYYASPFSLGLLNVDQLRALFLVSVREVDQLIQCTHVLALLIMLQLNLKLIVSFFFELFSVILMS